MSNRRRKTIGLTKIHEALERRLQRGQRKHEAKMLRAQAKRLRDLADATKQGAGLEGVISQHDADAMKQGASLEDVMRQHGVNATPGPRGYRIARSESNAS